MTDTQTLQGLPVPFMFTPAQVEGFMEYAPVYSEFRILKAKIEIVDMGVYNAPSGSGPGGIAWSGVSQNPFAVVSSQPFTSNYAVINATPQPVVQNLTIVALTAKAPDALLQSRWARLRKPRTTETGITIGFYPYQLTWAAHGIATAAGANNGYVEQRSGRRWMPMSFFGATVDQSNPADDVVFLGPYIPTVHISARRQAGGSTEDGDWPLNAIKARLTLYMQFRGQK